MMSSDELSDSNEVITSRSSSGISSSDEMNSMRPSLSSESIDEGSVTSDSYVRVNNDVSNEKKDTLKHKFEHEVSESEPLAKKSVCIFTIFNFRQQ